MKVASLPLGPIGANCYILYGQEEEGCIVIDPGDEPESLVRQLDRLGLMPAYILITHGHPDHTGGVTGLKKEYPEAKVMIHEADNEKLGTLGMGYHAPGSVDPTVADAFLHEGDEICCGSMRLKVIHTPGHSPGGVSLYAEEDGCVFTGDTLFRASIGRSDFPGGNYDDLEYSILQKLYSLPPETVVYPGHSSATSIGEEMEYNPFIRAGSSEG